MEVLGWMWVSILLNGFVLSAVIIAVYTISLHHYLGVVFLDDILKAKEEGQVEFRGAGSRVKLSDLWI